VGRSRWGAAAILKNSRDASSPDDRARARRTTQESHPRKGQISTMAIGLCVGGVIRAIPRIGPGFQLFRDLVE